MKFVPIMLQIAFFEPVLVGRVGTNIERKLPHILVGQIHNTKDLISMQDQQKLLQWDNILRSNTNRSIRKRSLVKRKVRAGIPNAMRQSVYKTLCQFTPRISTSCSERALEDIRLDLHRTFGQERPSKQMIQKFERVLIGIAAQFPKIGYCQGMNFWVYRLVEVLGEDQGWRIAYNLLNFYEVGQNYSKPESIKKHTAVISSLLARFEPKLAKRLAEQEIQLIYFTPSWIFTLFARTFSSQLFFRFLDCLLYEGYKVVYRCSLGILKVKQQKLMVGTRDRLLQDLGQLRVEQERKVLQYGFKYSFSREELSKLLEQHQL